MVRRVRSPDMNLDRLFKVIWFDSLGAKSASILLHGNDCDVLVDPGAAAMQPSYPLPDEEKKRLRKQALSRIAAHLSNTRVKGVIITHYHYDHHPRPGDPLLPLELFRGKTIIAKNPNEYINESQWRRAREFYEKLAQVLGIDKNSIYSEPISKEYVDPIESLPVASSRRFPGYEERRKELLVRGKKWFKKLIGLWSKGPWLSEVNNDTVILWADEKKITLCGVEIEFTEPWFHGIEYDRTGWVIGFNAKIGNASVFYTSDVMGPIIEDYAIFIVEKRPDVVVLDGPPTYLYPYMFNRINLERAIKNAITIIDSHPHLIIYDHHLLRERKWRERVSLVLSYARQQGIRVVTAAEYLGKKPLIDTL